MGTPNRPLQIILQDSAFSNVSLLKGDPCRLYEIALQSSPYLTEDPHSNSADTELDVMASRRLVVGDGCFNRVSNIDFALNRQLKSISIGSFSLCWLSNMVLCDMPELERVEIGESSLCYLQDDVIYLSNDLQSFDTSKSVISTKELRITHCPKLKSFVTHERACWKYSIFVIEGRSEGGVKP